MENWFQVSNLVARLVQPKLIILRLYGYCILLKIRQDIYWYIMGKVTLFRKKKGEEKKKKKRGTQRQWKVVCRFTLQLLVSVDNSEKERSEKVIMWGRAKWWGWAEWWEIVWVNQFFEDEILSQAGCWHNTRTQCVFLHHVPFGFFSHWHLPIYISPRLPPFFVYPEFSFFASRKALRFTWVFEILGKCVNESQLCVLFTAVTFTESWTYNYNSKKQQPASLCVLKKLVFVWAYLYNLAIHIYL